MPRPRAAALALATGIGLVGCSADGSAPSGTVQGDAEACPGDVLDVVVSVAQWGDVVEQLAGDCANVTTVLGSAAVDPHDYEPSTGDIASFSDADLVVLNGADYDPWATDAVDALDPRPAVVEAAEVAGVAEGGDPHVWYSPDAVQQTAAAVTGELTALSPDAADAFADAATAWSTELQPLLDELTALQGLAPGRSYAATEGVFDRTAEAVGLTDATPPGYRTATSNEGEPSPGDIAAFQELLTVGGVDVLVFNAQTEGGLTDQLRTVAEDAGVPVVEVTESAPEDAGSFVSWQLAQLQQLSDALGSPGA